VKPLRVPTLSAAEKAELETLYRTTKLPRLRTRAQMVLLAAENELKVPEVARIVLESESTVFRWLTRLLAEGVEGLKDAPRVGRPVNVTHEYREKLLEAVRHRPRSLDQPFSLWTLQRLADHLAEVTGIRVCNETVRMHLKKADIVLSRPQHKISSPDPEYLVKKRRLKRPATA
jgi:transposase